MSAEQSLTEHVAVKVYADLDALFGNGDVETADVVLRSGAVVKVRGLKRMELLVGVKGQNAEDSQLIEARNLAACVLEPRMTVEQAERWQACGLAGDLGDVVATIRRLSGLADGAAKSGVAGNGADRS